MREQIEAITKQVEKIKEIAFTNRENLEYEQKDLTEGEIDKIRESQKIAEDITAYNIVNEYEKNKRMNTYIRFSYTAIMIVVLISLWVMTSDYIKVKIQNEDVKNIEKQKNAFEQKTQELTEKLNEAIEKSNSLSALVKQKDEQIDLLKKSVSITASLPSSSESITQSPDSDTQSNENTTKTGASMTQTQTPTTLSGSTQSPEIKRCLTQTTITINVRDTAGLDGKVITFLDEGTDVEVLTKQVKNDRIWYEIKNNKITGWISSVWVEAFDSSCLK